MILLIAGCKKDNPSRNSKGPNDPNSAGYYDHGAYFGPTQEETNYSGAYYTGVYTSPFKTLLDKRDPEINTKLDQLWNHYFKGDANSRLYYDCGNEAYILNVAENYVTSEGMSYGMMIAVQTNHRQEFDKLWAWTKNHMWRKSGSWNGYFASICMTDGTVSETMCCPVAEMYMMMSLIFAANRWNNSAYMEDAQYILNNMWNNPSFSLFDSEKFIIKFIPTVSFSNPSYDLPAFLELFSRWSDTNREQWARTIEATRNHLYNSSNRYSGLFPECSDFTGIPQSYSQNPNSTKYMYDAMRCAMNIGMDYYLFGVDAERQTVLAKRLIDFFEEDRYQHARFNWDGSSPSESYTVGEAGANAVICYALMGTHGYEIKIKRNLQKAWDGSLLTGQYRYHDGLVHYLSMLHLCGSFKIWKEKPKND